MDEVKNAKLYNFFRAVEANSPHRGNATRWQRGLGEAVPPAPTDVKYNHIFKPQFICIFPAAERDLAKRIKPIRNWMKRHTFQTTIYYYIH